MNTVATTYSAWNDLQRARLTSTLVQLRILRTLTDCAIGRVQAAQFEARPFDDVRHHLRDVAPAIASVQLLAALEKEEEWRARDAAGELDPEWDYEQMVGQYRRAAIAAARLVEPALAALTGSPA